MTSYRKINTSFIVLAFMIMGLSNTGFSSETTSIYEIAPDPENLPIPPLPTTPPARANFSGELDELLGDTVHVGTTYWEDQHNGTVGRMIGYFPDDFQIKGVGTGGETAPEYDRFQEWYTSEEYFIILQETHFFCLLF